jgi:hypothetical protein
MRCVQNLIALCLFDVSKLSLHALLSLFPGSTSPSADLGLQNAEVVVEMQGRSVGAWFAESVMSCFGHGISAGV